MLEQFLCHRGTLLRLKGPSLTLLDPPGPQNGPCEANFSNKQSLSLPAYEYQSVSLPAYNQSSVGYKANTDFE